MEFNEKLQELRKKKGLTQEELAEILYVSRTAVSKWESGRGYPNIDSIKAISAYFNVTIDSLLSGDEILNIAEKENKQKEKHFCNIVFGLLDFSVIMLFLLPFFGQKTGEGIEEVSLLFLTETSLYLRILYYVFVVGIVFFGIFNFVIKNSLWDNNKIKASLILNAAAAFLFTISLQPYAAGLLFVFLMIKVLMLIKW